MPNMNPKKNEMPTRDPAVRRRDFLEVAVGYTEAQAADEAQRCLNCKNKPCVSGCPVAVSIPFSAPRRRRSAVTEMIHLFCREIRFSGMSRLYFFRVTEETI